VRRNRASNCETGRPVGVGEGDPLTAHGVPQQADTGTSGAAREGPAVSAPRGGPRRLDAGSRSSERGGVFARKLCGAVAGTVLSCTHSIGPMPAMEGGTSADSGPGADGDDGTTVLVGPSGEHSFLPPSLTVPVGTTVRWFWVSDGHTVTSGVGGVSDGLFCSPSDSDCSSGNLSNIGTMYQHTFSTAGTYPYFCVPHYSFGMKGVIVVK
jgi:plastocyanin